MRWKGVALRLLVVMPTMLACGVLGGLLAVVGFFTLDPPPDPCPSPCDVPAMVAIGVATYVGLPVGMLVGLILGRRLARRWVPAT
jgi:hypothetical protein